MAQHTNVARPLGQYTRADFTALRAHLNRLPLTRIANLYYAEDERERLGLNGDANLRRRLDDLCDELVQRTADANPALAAALHAARRGGRWSKLAIDYLVQAANQPPRIPQPGDPVSIWLHRRLAVLLQNEGASTMAQLIALINARGAGWWRPIPRLGAGKAAALVRWLQAHAASLGELDPDTLRPSAPRTSLVLLVPEQPVFVPFERISLPAALCGADGRNRNHTFCLIAARNDLDAIEAYLYKFRAQDKTRRAYQKELERFLLWCIYARRQPLSSTLLEDCEAYKNFLADPPAFWIGPRALRMGSRWKPFADRPSASSQRYAVQVIRTCFTWLVDVRYLSGNPWVAVSDPPVIESLHPIQIDKALPTALWAKLIGILDGLCDESDDALRARFRLRGAAAAISLPAQFRLARGALLLLGDAGLRRAEVAGALRNQLRPLHETPELWELAVLGKRQKWRTTFLPLRAIAALQAHWADRGLNFSLGGATVPLLAPLVIPPTVTAMRRHLQHDSVGLTPDGVYQVVRRALLRIVADPASPLEPDESKTLLQAGPHAFRHTFGTTAAAAGVPIEVLQKAFGHVSLQTTTIYVQAEKQRSIEELGKFFRQQLCAAFENSSTNSYTYKS